RLRGRDQHYCHIYRAAELRAFLAKPGLTVWPPFGVMLKPGASLTRAGQRLVSIANLYEGGPCALSTPAPTPPRRRSACRTTCTFSALPGNGTPDRGARGRSPRSAA